MTDLCQHCGRPEAVHCTFVAALSRPANCECDDLTTWGGHVGPICETFVARSDVEGTRDDYCTICEHDLACHS